MGSAGKFVLSGYSRTEYRRSIEYHRYLYITSVRYPSIWGNRKILTVNAA